MFFCRTDSFRAVRKRGEADISGNSATLAEQLELGKRSQEEYRYLCRTISEKW